MGWSTVDVPVAVGAVRRRRAGAVLLRALLRRAHRWELPTPDGAVRGRRAPGHLGHPRRAVRRRGRERARCRRRSSTPRSPARPGWPCSRTGSARSDRCAVERGLRRSSGCDRDASCALPAPNGIRPEWNERGDRRHAWDAVPGPGARLAAAPGRLVPDPVGCRGGCPGDQLSTRLAATPNPGGPTREPDRVRAAPPGAPARRRRRRGPRRPARPGRRGHRRRVRRPARGRPRVAGAGRRVAAPRRPRRGLRSRLQRRAARPDRRHARHRRRDERRHPGRRVARAGAGHRLPPGQPRHGRARGPRVDRPRHRRARRPRGRRPRRARHDPGRPRLDPEGGDLWETLARLDAEGCARYVVTDVAKDGMLQGPNLALLRDVCARTDRPVVASGGVSTLEDVVGDPRRSSARGSRARSSARRSTAGPSPCPRRSTWRAARERPRARPRPRAHRLGGGAVVRARPVAQRVRDRHRRGRPRAARGPGRPRRRPRPDGRRRGRPVRRAGRRRAHRGRQRRRARRRHPGRPRRRHPRRPRRPARPAGLLRHRRPRRLGRHAPDPCR